MVGLWMFVGTLSMAYLMPGPDMVLVLDRVTRYGRRHALACVLGLGLARASHVVLASLGLATLLNHVSWGFETVRFLGAIYLLWLGLMMMRQPLSFSEVRASKEQKNFLYRASFLRGFLTNLMNPKAFLFCSILLPQFIHGDLGPAWEQFLFLGAILVFVGFLFDMFYVVVGAVFNGGGLSSPSFRFFQRWGFGTLLIGFALNLMFVTL